MFELPAHDHLASDGPTKRRFALDKTEDGLGCRVIDDLLPSYAGRHLLLQLVGGEGRAAGAEHGPCILLGLQQPVNHGVVVRAQFSGLRLQLLQVPYLLRVPDLRHVLLERRDLAAGVQRLIRTVQILRPRDPPPPLHRRDQFLPVPDGRSELRLGESGRLPPQFQLPYDRAHHRPGLFVVQSRFPLAHAAALPPCALPRTNLRPFRPVTPGSPDGTGRATDGHRPHGPAVFTA